MPKVKVIVFDLFDTLIRDIKFDFESGLHYLYKNILRDGTNEEEFFHYVNTYWKDLYDKRNEDDSELPFDQVLLDLKEKYGFKVNWSLDDIQYKFAIAVNDTELFPNTISTLERINSLNIPIYLLSNIIFIKEIALKIINQYDLEKYFINTYFSADYKVRKPHRDFFQVVYDDIKLQYDQVVLEEVLFVGDNYYADVIGAKNFGFTPVFLNRNQKWLNEEKVIEIKSLDELFELNIV